MDLLPNAKSFLVLDGLKDRSFWHWYDNIGPGDSDLDPTFDTRYSSYGRPKVSWDLHVVQSILRAISLSDTRIKSLTLGVGGSNQDQGAVPFTPTRFTGIDSGLARSALRSLTKLSIQFKRNSDSNSGLVESHVSNLELQRSSLIETRALVGWLSGAQNLQELTLEFCPALDWTASRELLETAVWPSLRAIRLANIRCRTFCAAGFLKRHMLKMAEFEVIGPDSVDVCRGLAAFTEVHLEEVLAKSARDNGRWPSDITLRYMRRGSVFYHKHSPRSDTFLH